MTTPDDSTCTINAVSTSLPLKVCSSSVAARLVFLLISCSYFCFAIQALCSTVSQWLKLCKNIRWRTWTVAWPRSKTTAALAATGRPATTSATPAPASSDGFNSSVSRDPIAHHHWIPRNAVSCPMHPWHNSSHLCKCGNRRRRRKQSDEW